MLAVAPNVRRFAPENKLYKAAHGIRAT